MSPEIVVQASLVIMGLAFLVAFLRLLRGPTLPDRVVAFDLLTLHVLGMVCGTAILTGAWLLLDAAIILALMTFIATIAFARYMERKAKLAAGRDARA